MKLPREQMVSPFGEFILERVPAEHDPSLRAWDAADEYVLQELSNYLLSTKGGVRESKIEGQPEETRELLAGEKIRSDLLSEAKEPSILIVNDQFGALALALQKHNPVFWSDSHLAKLAWMHNSNLNDLSVQVDEQFVSSVEMPVNEQGKQFDLIVIKVPKSLALLEHQLAIIKPLMAEHTRLVGTGMVKHIHNSTLSLFEKYIGPTTTSLAKKKARLIFSKQVIAEKIQNISLESPYPSSFYCKFLECEWSNHANVFALDKMDIGALAMLECLSSISKKDRVIDLGCGSGILGVAYQKQYPESHMTFVDESYMALASAKDNHGNILDEPCNVEFIVSDCLDEVKGSVDLILCNPPFHQQHVVGSFIAKKMIKQSYQQLTLGGELWLVGNRHLDYHNILKRQFNSCELVFSNKKFVVFKAVK